MKIEKINDYQIRCTLTEEDLAGRDIKLSELAYGTDKARELFGDLIQEAEEQVGFYVDDIPLMIEAVPIGKASIILIVTKVEDPEEMDTRFANYAPSVQYDESGDDPAAEGGEDTMGMFRRIQQGDFPLLTPSGKMAQGRGKLTDTAAKRERTSHPAGEDFMVWSFDSMHDVISLAELIGSCKTENSLYRDPSSGRVILLLKSEGLSQEESRRMFGYLSEFGCEEKSFTHDRAYIDEHLTSVVRENALQSLAGLN